MPGPPDLLDGRVPALDGLRAVAVLLVVAYHFGVPGVTGGFVGVDVFFVLSGFLITSLLVGERRRSGGVDVPAFWARRVRRLLPALVVMVVVVTLVVRFAEPAGLFPGYRADALATLSYCSNWWQVATSADYFTVAGAMSPLTHTWSLAVEEQFYLVWPLVAVVVFRRCRRSDRSVTLLGALAAAGALASAVEMALLAADGASPTRLYVGTDTHAQPVLVGAALACALAVTSRRRPEAGAAHRGAGAAAGVVGLVALAAAAWRFDGTSGTPYRGGFLVVALAAAAMVASVVTAPTGPLARLCTLRPLRWVGTVSYGIYLWHLPVAVVLDGARTGLTGLPLAAVRLAVTLVLAGTSYVLIERPVRERRFWRSARAFLPAAAAVGATVAAVVGATVTTAGAGVPPSAVTAPAGVTGRLRAELASAHAFTTRPVRFLVVGDSVALTLGIGLAVDGVRRYGVQVVDRGIFGCDLDNLPAVLQGQLQSPISACRSWPTVWRADVDAVRPDVAGLLIGWWALADHPVDGTTEHVGEPAWDARLVREYTAAVDLLASSGALVVVFTFPDIAPPGEQPDGTPWPEDQPARAAALAAVLRRVVAASGGRATLVDLRGALDPGGTFHAVVDGVTVRWADGIHVTRAGGEWLRPLVLPTVARLGLEARAP